MTSKSYSVQEAMGQIALPLMAFKHDSVLASGTATVIAPGIAITAKHVIEDFWKKYGHSSPIVYGSDNLCNCNIVAWMTCSDTGEKVPLRVPRCWFSETTDAAILKLAQEPNANRKMKFKVKMRPVLPSTGDRVCGFGYAEPKTTTHTSADNPLEFRIDWTARTYGEKGTVGQVFHPIRDRVKLPFPCFETDANFRKSMSGGPVFDAEGRLCGIICSGVENQEGWSASYAMSLQPILETPIQIVSEDGSEKWCLLYDLVQRGILAIDNNQEHRNQSLN